MSKKLAQSLPIQMVIAAALACVLGYALPNTWLEPDSQFLSYIALGKIIYIGLLKMFVGVVVLFALLHGIIQIGSVVRLKSIGLKTIGIYTLTSTFAIILGLGTALMMPEWPQLANLPTAAETAGIKFISEDAAASSNVVTKILSLALVNPVSALSSTNLLAIVVFALMLGIAILFYLPEKHPVYAIVDGLNTVITKVIAFIVRFAPIAIFSIVLEFTAQGNASLFGELAQFALLVLVLTAIHGGIVLPALLKLFTGRPIIATMKQMSAPMLMAFATSSSSATLPLSLQTAKEKLNVSDSTSSMVLPLGSIMNMDGTALFEGVAAVFLAQLFGIDLGTTEIVLIFIMAMVSSIGAPGMPSGSMSGMQIVLLAAGIPLEGIAILLLIERPLDTFRTSVNVEGDLIAAMIVDKWQTK